MSIKTSPFIKLPDLASITDPATKSVVDQLIRFIYKNQSNIYDDLKNIGYHDRGDPSAVDFNEVGAKSVLNTDGSYHDLDLSAIVPVDTKAILIRVSVLDDAAGSSFSIRKNGNTHAINLASIATQVANVTNYADFVVFCDSSRIVEYVGSNVAFTGITLSVAGWWL